MAWLTDLLKDYPVPHETVEAAEARIGVLEAENKLLRLGQRTLRKDQSLLMREIVALRMRLERSSAP